MTVYFWAYGWALFMGLAARVSIERLHEVSVPFCLLTGLLCVWLFWVENQQPIGGDKA